MIVNNNNKKREPTVIGDGDTNRNRSTWSNPQWIGHMRTSGDRINYSIIKIGKNTEKSPGDLKRLAVTQTPRGVMVKAMDC